MNLTSMTSIRTAIGIGAVALTLAGGLAPGLVDAKDHQGGKGGARAEREAAAQSRLPSAFFTCNGVRVTMILSPNQAGQPVLGTDGRDVVFGTSGRDIFVGNGGDDVVCLFGGNDSFRPGSNASGGSDGNDTVRGGTGSDDIDGGQGNDDLRGGDGPDFFSGGFGQDSCLGGPGADAFIGPGTGGCESVNSIP